VKELGEFPDMSPAKLSFAVEDERCDRARAVVLLKPYTLTPPSPQ